MNEQLINTMNNASTVLIEKAISGLDNATDFLQAEIPEYVYQLMLWYGVKSAILCLIGFILAALSVKMFFSKYGMTKGDAKKAYENREPWTRCDGSSVTSAEYDWIISKPDYFYCKLSSLLIFVISTFFLNLEWLQIWIAPKVWLVEYASTIIK